MKKALVTCLALALASTSILPALAQATPKVVQRSLIFNTYDHGRFWPDPKKEPIYGKPAWTPNNLGIDFLVEGPITDGGQLSVEFLRPDGKPWISLNCMTPQLEAGAVENIKECDDIVETQAQTFTGFVPVQIRYKNELEGVNSVLYKGRLKIGTYKSKIGNQIQHYIDEDWRLPLAFIAIDEANDEDAPILIAWFWFKQRKVSSGDLVAYLFHNGKQVAINTDLGGYAQEVVDRSANLEAADPKQEYSYHLWNFHFSGVKGRIAESDTMTYPGAHNLAKNPGQYEIKVLNKGKLVRVASFSVGADGKVVAPGSVEFDGAGNKRMLIPTKVLGDMDVPWDRNAYKTEVYYGNPSPKTAGILAP